MFFSILRRVKNFVVRILTTEPTALGQITKEVTLLFLILTVAVGVSIFQSKMKDRDLEARGILDGVEGVLKSDRDALLLQFLLGSKDELQVYFESLQRQFPRVQFCGQSDQFSVPQGCAGLQKEHRRLAEIESVPSVPVFKIEYSVDPASIFITVYQTLMNPFFWLMPAAGVLFGLLVNIRLRFMFKRPLERLKNQLERFAKGDRQPEAIGKRKYEEWGNLNISIRELVRYISEIESVSLRVGRVDIARQICKGLAQPLALLREIVESGKPIDRSALRAAMEGIDDVARDLASSTANPLPGQDVVIEKQRVKICGAVELMRKLMDERRSFFKDRSQVKISLEIFPGCDSMKVAVDPHLVMQSLSHIIDNGVESMVRDGRLRVRMRPQNREGILIQVVDEGVGIDATMIDQVADKGFTFGKTDRAGIGLSFAKSVIEQLDGELRIESRKGAGTTVTVMLPVVKDNQRRAVAPPPDHSLN